MAGNELLVPTLHVEVLLKGFKVTPHLSKEIRTAVAEHLVEDYDALKNGEKIDGFRHIKHEAFIAAVEITGFTGPENKTGTYGLKHVQLDVQTYVLRDHQEGDPRRTIKQSDEDPMSQARIFTLPSTQLHDEWNSLVFDDGLPARLLRYLARMVSMMRQPGLNLSTFNWNRLCLLHGPPGSGKSTLCRALAQKLSIRLGDTFPNATLIEINTNSMLSKYFGESGKLISSMFERVYAMAQDQSNLLCLVMDEVETIAGSRERSTTGNECRDGLRATDQLLTALDRLRTLPNVIILCTSNLIDAIDSAFLDRVDIKQLVPCPSPAAIYNIFRSCINELIRSSLINAAAAESVSSTASAAMIPAIQTARKPATRSVKSKAPAVTPNISSSPEPWTVIAAPSIPTLAEMHISYTNQPKSPARRVWALTQRCGGFSGRNLRRLPILALAKFTWGGDTSLDDAVSAAGSCCGGGADGDVEQ